MLPKKEIHGKKTKIFMGALFFFAFAALCVWFLTNGNEPSARQIAKYGKTTIEVMPYAGIALFGLMGGYYLLCLLSSKPELILDAQGFKNNTMFAKKKYVAWQDVLDLREVYIKRNHAILIITKPDSGQKPEEVIILPGVLQTSYDETFDLFATYLAEANPSENIPDNGPSLTL